MKFEEIIKTPAIRYVILGIVILVVLWYVRDIVSGIFKKGDEAERDPEVCDPDLTNLSYPIINYTNWANRIEVALENLYNDDEDAVYNVFEQMHNNDDVCQLQIAFGTRARTPWGIGMIGGYTGTLSEWLTAQFNQSEINQVNEILAEKNITIQF